MYFVEYNVENNSNEEQVENQGESGDLIYMQLWLITHHTDPPPIDELAKPNFYFIEA